MSSKLFAVRRSNSKTSLVTPLYSPESILKLNVGGKRFDTRLRTLLADREGSMFKLFACLLEAGAEYKFPQRDDEGLFFLDMDPEEFRILLNNLRFLTQLQGCPEQDKESMKESMDVPEDDLRSIRTGGLWSRIAKKSSINNSA